jgi:hypothetical protein
VYEIHTATVGTRIDDRGTLPWHEIPPGTLCQLSVDLPRNRHASRVAKGRLI